MKDWVEMLATGLGVLGALILFGYNAVTARHELRRKHAESGRSLVTEMCEDREVKNAFALLDMEDDTEVALKDDAGGEHATKWETAIHAMRDTEESEKAILVRPAFDALFYYFALFQNSINAGLVHQSDVDYPSAYFIRILGQYKEVFGSYVEYYELTQAKQFLERWPDWKQPVPVKTWPRLRRAADKTN